MTGYESNADYENSIVGRKKDDFMIYYRDFDSNINKKDDTMSVYETLINVNDSLNFIKSN